ncbi:MAG TPA: F0F1 ATP synthase subunit A [Candidatus Polarisedimenticolia bacterium]|jgi:F-type H+-transporting ATPase subunit a|nr:F0F1 ATP synthase subunit A [Candidatus Polarisedimenticolia bacterium]
MASLFTLLAQEATKTAEPGGAGHAAAAAAEHAGGEKVDAGHMILEHLLDSHTLDIFGFHVPLPEIHLFGFDLSITKYVVMMWIASAILLVVGILAARIHRHSPGRLGHLIEMAILFIRDELAVPNIGKHGARFVPYLLTTFLFILICNLLGLVPLGATATGNISVTLALALIAFVMIQAAGIREYGVLRHFRNLVPHGVPLWLLPLMIPVEIAGMLIKPVTLCVRLFANMLGGHIVILSLLGLIFILGTAWVAPVSVGFALFINFLELLVAFIQAYIFTMLTSLFIGMSVHPH